MLRKHTRTTAPIDEYKLQKVLEAAQKEHGHLANAVARDYGAVDETLSHFPQS